MSREIRGVLIQTGDERLLLPNATVAEVIPHAQVELIKNSPEWLIGYFQWHEWKVPLLALVQMLGKQDPAALTDQKILVFKTLSGNPKMPYWAIITPLFPQLVVVPRDSLLAEATEENLPQLIRMRAILGDQSVIIPDLDVIESTLMSLLTF